MGWLPEGYELVESRATNRTILRRYTKSGADMKQRIDIRIMDFSDEGVFKIDTEADEVYQVLVQNTLATVIERDNSVQLIWMYPESNCIIMLCWR